MIIRRRVFFHLAILLFTTCNLYGQGLFLIDKDKSSDTINFTSNLKDVSFDLTSKGKGTFSGSLPAGMIENYAAWAASTAHTELKNDESGAYLRLSITKYKTAAQFYIPVETLEPGRIYRLSMQLRNTISGPVSFGVRMIPPPYTTLWSAQVEPGSGWQKKEWVFQVKEKSAKPLGLFIYVSDTGALDLVSAKFEEFSSAQVAALSTRPPESQKNFFRNSRLPSGLQSGWNIDRDNASGTVAVDATIKGPSGENVLKLVSDSDKAIGLYSEPFNVANPLAKNQVSLACKGNGEWTISVVGPNRWIPLARRKITAGSEWRRETIMFAPDVMAKAFALRIEGRGTLWIDAFRATGGETPQDYASAGNCETALSLPKSDADDARIQFMDEKPEVKYYVSGDYAGADLIIRAANLYRESRELAVIRLDSSSNSGTVNYDVFPEQRYGQFRIETHVEKNGKAISPYNELVITRLPRPLYWNKDAPESAFGTHAMAFPPSLNAVKAAGCNWVRLHDVGNDLNWSELEPEKGKWQFRDDAIMLYRRHNLKIFGSFSTAPRWASYLSKVKEAENRKTNYFDHYFQPLSMDDFGNYVKTVAARYRGVIDEYFVWNEPWMAAFWSTGCLGGVYTTSKNPDLDFARLMEAAYKAAKEVDPNIKVSGFNTKTGSSGNEWTRGVYDAGGMRSCDMIDFHVYENRLVGGSNNIIDASYNDAIGYVLAKENGKLSKPVYMSEGQGAASEASACDTSLYYAGIYKYAVPWKNDEDYTALADKNCRFVVSLLAKNIKRVFLYSTHCYCNLSRPASFLALLGGDGYPHPMLAANAAMTLRLENKKFVERRDLKDGLSVYIFSDGSNSAAVIFGRSGIAKSMVTSSAKNAVGADIYGNPLPLPAVYGEALIYLEAPVSADEFSRSLSVVK